MTDAYVSGFDLNGNTFWEFRLTNNPAERWRRIVKYPRSTHLSSVKVTPAWHQWLRYTREHPPSLAEQREDVTRQARMKQLAAEADARWEAKPRLVEDTPQAARLEPRADAAKDQEPTKSGVEEARKGTPETKKEEEAYDPWAQHRSTGPGETWQPTTWDPTKPKA